MSERKIRLTLSSTLNNDVGAIIDIDFNEENLDTDLYIAAENGVTNLIKEYTVDVDAGVYNLDISYKNDVAEDLDHDGSFESDRNLVIEKIEIANNGVDFEFFPVTELNSNLSLNTNFSPMGWLGIVNPDYDPSMPKEGSNFSDIVNPDFDSSLPRTDVDGYNGYVYGYSPPGDNPKFLYQLVIEPTKIFNNSTATFQIAFS